MAAAPIRDEYDPAVCLVLAGLAAAGKTSLLGALAQAAQTQSAVLGSTLDSASEQILDPLEEQTYKQMPPPAAEDPPKSYPVTFQKDGTQLEATLIDTGGRSAQELLTDKKALSSRTPLARSVRSADTLLLVVDASAKPAELESDFQKLGRFVSEFEQHRAHQSDVAGLPVYLVLSKCDLLARPDDTSSVWMQRIEEGKRKIGARFHDFLAAQTGRDKLPFGKIDLHLWATAVKRPQLADRPARPTEPYGVAELFRQCLESARLFRQHRRRAERRTAATVSGVSGLVGALALLAGLFLLARPSAELVALQNEVRAAIPASAVAPRPDRLLDDEDRKSRQMAAAERLREPLEDRLKQLQKIEAHPQFSRLPAKEQQDVRGLRAEMEAYSAVNATFLKIQDPRFATREEDVAKIGDGLAEVRQDLGELRLSPPYGRDWDRTKLLRRLERWEKDLRALRQAIKDEEKWVREQIAAADALVKEGGLVLAKNVAPAEREAWFDKAHDYLDRDRRHKSSERIAEAAAVTYDTVYRFSTLQQARTDWDKAKANIRSLYKVLKTASAQ